ncbi:OsmC family protein [Microvirga roseola]|uniref:OsmC family protein n=1 Tax=Microvirga roseola TaxID=2883126 RepID=UPI001E30736D|nr:OsmC family protein [Microvirga roseola]
MTDSVLNGIDTAALAGFVKEIESAPDKSVVRFEVATEWQGGTKSVTKVAGYELSGTRIDREFQIAADEPTELLGSNSAPNPQELLLAAMNSCMTVGIAATAAAIGATINSLTIRTSGALDLRGFLGIEDDVKPGYEAIDYEVIMDGDFTPEQFQEIHDAVVKTSPNRWNIANAINLKPKLTSLRALASATGNAD